jgi:hypothetical protein
MKKLFLSLAVVMSVSLFSCGNGAEGNAADTTATDTLATETTIEVEETAAVDTVAPVEADSTVAAPAAE